MVSKVEAFDVTDLKNALSGLNDGETSAINLKLNKDKKKGLLGNGQLAYGTANRYKSGGSLNAICDGRVIVSTLDCTNIGQDFSHAGNTFIQQTRVDLHVNYSDNWSSKIMASGTASTGILKTNSFVAVNRQNFLGDSILIENRKNESNFNLNPKRFDGQVRIKLDSISSLIYSPRVDKQQRRSISEATINMKVISAVGNTYILSSAVVKDQEESNNNDFENKFMYERRFKKKGRYLLGIFLMEMGKQHGINNFNSTLLFYDSTGGITGQQDIMQKIFEETSVKRLVTSLDYIEPIAKGKSIRLLADFFRIEHNTDKKSLDYNPVTHQYDQLDSATSNSFDNAVAGQTWTILFNSTGKQLNFIVRMEAMMSQVQNKNYTQHISTNQHQLNYAPSATIIHKLNKTTSLHFDYKGSLRRPDFEQLQPVHNIQNSFLILLGNPNLKNEFSHNSSFQLSAFNPKTFGQFSVSVSANIKTRKIIASTTYTGQAIQELQYVNAPQNVYNLQGQIAYSLQFGEKRRNKIGISNSTVYGKDLSFLNTEPNITKQFSLEPEINISYSLRKLTLEMRSNFQYRALNYSLMPNSTFAVLTQRYYVNITYEFPYGIFFFTRSDIGITKSGALQKQNTIGWNMVLSKRMLKKQALELKFSGFNLLNTTGNFPPTVGENFIETSKRETLNRFFLLGLVYNFDAFAKEKK
jgi:hypothetical protein